MLQETAANLKVTNINDLAARAAATAGEVRSLSKELADLKAAAAAAKIDGLFENAQQVEGVSIISAFFSGTDTDALRSMCEKVRDKLPCSVAALCSENEGKVTLAVSVGKEAQARGLKAGVLVKEIAAVAGGKGGGKPDMAMAGIKDANKVDEALAAVPEIVKANLK